MLGDHKANFSDLLGSAPLVRDHDRARPGLPQAPIRLDDIVDHKRE